LTPKGAGVAWQSPAYVAQAFQRDRATARKRMLRAHDDAEWVADQRLLDEIPRGGIDRDRADDHVDLANVQRGHRFIEHALLYRYRDVRVLAVQSAKCLRYKIG